MNHAVSRETPPPAPELARGVFSAALPLAERYAAALAGAGVTRGLIGPREVPRLWERHLVNCALLERGVSQDASVCDLGSGAGLPGLVLAIARPDLAVTVVEPLLRRSTFLSEVVAELGLDRVEVVRARAEELHGSREFDVVTSRAVAPLERLLDWSLPLVREGGTMLAMKGASAGTEVEAATATLRRHGAGAVSVEVYGADVIDPPTTAVRVVAARPSRLRWEPRAEEARQARQQARRQARGRDARGGGHGRGGRR